MNNISGDFKELIEFANFNDENILTLEMAKKYIEDDDNDGDNFYYLLNYCKKFPDFYLDPKLIDLAIEKDSFNFQHLIHYYIETGKNELTREIVKLAFRNNGDNFGNLILYCKKFPNFYLDTKLISYSIEDNFINISFYTNFTSEIINDIDFNKINIKKTTIVFDNNEFDNLINNLKNFIRLGKISKDSINNMLYTMYSSNREGFDIKFRTFYDKYEKELLDVFP